MTLEFDYSLILHVCDFSFLPFFTSSVVSDGSFLSSLLLDRSSPSFVLHIAPSSSPTIPSLLRPHRTSLSDQSQSVPPDSTNENVFQPRGFLCRLTSGPATPRVFYTKETRWALVSFCSSYRLSHYPLYLRTLCGLCRLLALVSRKFDSHQSK